MADNVIEFPKDHVFVDLDAIRRRAKDRDPGTWGECDDRDIAERDQLRHDVDDLLTYLDLQVEINDLGDLPKLDGTLEFCRIPQVVVARLQSGALAAVEHLKAEAAYYAALLTMSPGSPTVEERKLAAFEAMQLSRKAHGLPLLPKR